jgi:hypothetical protein
LERQVLSKPHSHGQNPDIETLIHDWRRIAIALIDQRSKRVMAGSYDPKLRSMCYLLRMRSGCYLLLVASLCAFITTPIPAQENTEQPIYKLTGLEFFSLENRRWRIAKCRADDGQKTDKDGLIDA